MSDQFRNFDAKGPQVVSIRWERLNPRDETAERPDEMQDGFWPSADPEAPGYIGEHTAAELAEAQAAAQARMDAWERDEWEYVGTIARAHIAVPIGGGSFVTFTIDSAGLWGTESDSEESYLESIFEDEKASLTGQLEALGRHVLGMDQGKPPAPFGELLEAALDLRAGVVQFEDDPELDAAKVRADAAFDAVAEAGFSVVIAPGNR